MPVLHNFVNPIADEPGFLGTKPSDWNDTHDVDIVDADVDAAAGIVESKLALNFPTHAPVTLGVANGLLLSGQQLSVELAGANSTGTLSAQDWNTFNNKQGALSFPLASSQGGTGINNSGTFVNHTNSILIGNGYTLTVPESLTVAGRNVANTFSALNTFNGNIGLAENDYIGYPAVIGASYMPTDSNYDSILNSLNHIYVNLDSGAGGGLRVFRVGKGRTGSTGGTDVFQVDTNGFFSFYLENSFMGYPGSIAQGYCPFTSSYNSLFNSLFNHYFIIDTGNGSTTQKFVWAHNGTTESAAEIASLTEAGNLSTIGAFQPGSMADTDALNNSIYYSTDAGRLVYKDFGGVVNNLY